jgi:hypothetical protein
VVGHARYRSGPLTGRPRLDRPPHAGDVGSAR